MIKDSCEVYLSGLFFDVRFKCYRGRKGTQTTPPESPELEIIDVRIWDKKIRRYIPADDFIDSWSDFEDSVSEQIWDYIGNEYDM